MRTGTEPSPKSYAAFMIWEATHMRWMQSRAATKRAERARAQQDDPTVRSKLIKRQAHLTFMTALKAVSAYIRSAKAGDVARKHAPHGTVRALHALSSPSGHTFFSRHEPHHDPLARPT